MQAPVAEQAGGATSTAYVVHVQGLSLSIDAEQLQRHAAAAFGSVLAAEVAPSESRAATRTGTVVFASLDAALRATAHWQGACELGQAVAAQLAVPPGLQPPQQASSPQQAPPAPQQQAQQQQAQQQAQQQQQAESAGQRAPRSPQRRKPMPKPAIVVRGLQPTTTVETLYAAFGPAGPIKRLRLVTDEQGSSAGVAFITFQSAAGVQRGLQLGEGIVIDGQRPTVGPAHRETDSEEQAQQAQQEQQEQQAAGESQPQQRAQQGQPHAQPHAQQARQAQQAPSPAGPGAWYMQRRGSFSGLPAGGTGWEVQLHRAGSSPTLSGLGVGSSSPGGSLGTLSSPAGEASSNDTLFARPLAPEVDESALRDLFGEHAGVLSVRVLRLPDGSSRGCGFVRFAEPSQAQLALQALNGVQLFGRTLRLSWAHQRQPHHSLSPSPEGGGRLRSFGPSSSGDFSPTAPRLAPGAAMGMVQMMPASQGYTCAPVMMSPVYWPAGGMYVAPVVPAMPPGSPILGSPVPGSPVVGSPFQFAQPMAGFMPPPVALPPPAVPLDAGSAAQGWASQQPQWPPHWQPMSQLAAGGGSGVPWQPPGGFQFGQQPGGPGWQWQAQQRQPSSQFFWDGTTIPEVPGGAGAHPSTAARTPTAAPAPAELGSPSSGGEASVGSAVGAAHTSPGSPVDEPSPLHGLGQLATGASLSPPGSPTPDERSGDEWAGSHSSSCVTSAQPSSSQLPASEAEEQLVEPQDAAAPAAEDAGVLDEDAEAAVSSLERLHID